ncbi:hypothetical protein GPA27_01900 [Aromatoleum toluolicum]|uniref:Uncharacterized protein n=1 Tax=Aromatoleum toluolicum TaxID=90060 RepID=A0ABX1NA37_9RHOO|nr:hypothetical protein [Aromatoleum toluolicum]NMF96150.1 hypothetical protein [Aromatoleum toluolicum]
MGIFGGIWNALFGGSTQADEALSLTDLHQDLGLSSDLPKINPTTGLPMVGDVGGLDVAGNAYGEIVAPIAHPFDSMSSSFEGSPDPFDDF